MPSKAKNLLKEFWHHLWPQVSGISNKTKLWSKSLTHQTKKCCKWSMSQSFSSFNKAISPWKGLMTLMQHPVLKIGRDTCVNLHFQPMIKTAVNCHTWYNWSQLTRKAPILCKMMTISVLTWTKTSQDCPSTAFRAKILLVLLITLKIRTTKVVKTLKQMFVKMFQMILSRTLQNYYNTPQPILRKKVYRKS